MEDISVLMDAACKRWPANDAVSVVKRVAAEELIKSPDPMFNGQHSMISSHLAGAVNQTLSSWGWRSNLQTCASLSRLLDEDPLFRVTHHNRSNDMKITLLAASLVLEAMCCPAAHANHQQLIPAYRPVIDQGQPDAPNQPRTGYYHEGDVYKCDRQSMQLSDQSMDPEATQHLRSILERLAAIYHPAADAGYIKHVMAEQLITHYLGTGQAYLDRASADKVLRTAMHNRRLLVEGAGPPSLHQLLAGDAILQWSEPEQRLHLNVWNLRAALLAVDTNSNTSSGCCSSDNKGTASSSTEDDSNNIVCCSRSSSVSSNMNHLALADDATSSTAASAKNADGSLACHETRQQAPAAAALDATAAPCQQQKQQLQDPVPPCPVRTWAEAAAKGGPAQPANSSSSASSTPTAAGLEAKTGPAGSRLTIACPAAAPTSSPRGVNSVPPATAAAAAAQPPTALTPAQVTAVTLATRLGHAWGGVHWAYPAISRDNFSKRALAKAILSRYPQTHTFEMEGGEAGVAMQQEWATRKILLDDTNPPYTKIKELLAGDPYLVHKMIGHGKNRVLLDAKKLVDDFCAAQVAAGIAVPGRKAPGTAGIPQQPPPPPPPPRVPSASGDGAPSQTTASGASSSTSTPRAAAGAGAATGAPTCSGSTSAAAVATGVRAIAGKRAAVTVAAAPADIRKPASPTVGAGLVVPPSSPAARAGAAAAKGVASKPAVNVAKVDASTCSLSLFKLRPNDAVVTDLNNRVVTPSMAVGHELSPFVGGVAAGPTGTEIFCSSSPLARSSSSSSHSGRGAVAAQSLCLGCKGAMRSVVLLPCMHLCFCTVCSERVAAAAAMAVAAPGGGGNSGDKGRTCCPLCRAAVDQHVAVFLK